MTSRQTQEKRPIGSMIRMVIGSLAGVLIIAISGNLMFFGGAAIDIGLVLGLAVLLMLMIGRSESFSRIRKRLLALTLSLGLSCGLIEIYLRVAKPFPILVRGGRIALPIHLKKEFESGNVKGLDPVIRVTFNSLGFRGPEPPRDWKDHLTIVCVGGSTTQCLYLSDGTTWPDRLADELREEFPKVWVNNAGLDGHSTFGHLQLLDQFLCELQPDVILFYVGINDVARGEIDSQELAISRSAKSRRDPVAKWIQKELLERSDFLALIDNLRLQRQASLQGLIHDKKIGHGELGGSPELARLSEEERRRDLEHQTEEQRIAYQNRLRQLVAKAQSASIRPVLMTQPVLYGAGIDDETGIDLERIKVGNSDGWTRWRMLEAINEGTCQVANQESIPLIDLASSVPKSTRYFYDLSHSNREGAEYIAKIVADELAPVLRDWFPPK